MSYRLISLEKENVGKETSLFKVAEIVADDSQDRLVDDVVESQLILKCPIFTCTDIFQSGNSQHTLELQTIEGRVEGVFIPDSSRLDYERGNLVAAEIVREVIFGSTGMKEGKREIEAVWSNGIVLERKKGEDIKVVYERVGRFWIQWPLVGVGDMRSGSALRRTGALVVYVS